MSIVYNSSVGSHQDDSDITIINPSIIHEPNDGYVNNNTQITNPQTINDNRKENVDGQPEYVYVQYNLQPHAKQLEEVLLSYIRDLKQETNTQNDCDQQLITRLMDLIRPAYQNDQKKMIELDKIMEEIASLHDKRHMEQREKMEQLRTEICQLNKMLCSTRYDQSLIYDDNNKNYSISNPANRGQSIQDYDQWTEIEDDAKKLHELVQSQKNQINEIVTLISQTATTPTSVNPMNISINDCKNTPTDTQATSTAQNNLISSLLKKIQHITGHQQPSTSTASQETTTLENHSPGVSPTESLATLILQPLQPTQDNQTQQIEDTHDEHSENPEPIREELPPIRIENPELKREELPHIPIDIPISPKPQTEPRKCPVCNHEFASTSDDMEMYDHIENCLFPLAPATQPKDYECPNCNRKYPGNDETAYLQHLTDCYNREI